MRFSNALLAGAAAGLVGVITSWLVTGVVFHPYQRLTPATWRNKEGPALFVNVHPGAVVGLLLDWLLVSVLAALAAAWAVLH